jgi:flotillin
MGGAIAVIFFALLILAVMFFASLKSIIQICGPNEVLIISGRGRNFGGRRFGYRITKGGRAFRLPLITRVDRMDLTNMVIDLQATNAYSKGGIPLTVQGVANIKVAGHEPLLNNAIERFLHKSRAEIVQIAKATLEGSLRGVLATMTPEQVNEDKILFAERLVQEVEQDMTALGLSVDTLKIQNVQDEVKYLDSIGRRKSAEVIRNARIAEARAKSESMIRSAENLERETKAQVDGQIAVANADADRKLLEIKTRRDALVAEELAQVNAAIAKARADLEVQKARVEQTRRRLEADVVAPAKAASEAAEAQAIADVAPIIEEGRARAEALRKVAATLQAAGSHGRELLLVQKLPAIIEAMTNVVAETKVDKVTVIDSGSGNGSMPAKALATTEIIKEVFGVDVVEKLKQLGSSKEPERVEIIREVHVPAPAPREPDAQRPMPPVRKKPKNDDAVTSADGFKFQVPEPDEQG